MEERGRSVVVIEDDVTVWMMTWTGQSMMVTLTSFNQNPGK